jgi:glycosyltransferase involved in cell wall biosynthesis
MSRAVLAIYGPKAPQRSGVAAYIDTMISTLRERDKIVHIGNDNWVDPRGFPHVLYHVGASIFHDSVLQAMRLKPGPAIVHENNILSYYYETWQHLPHIQRQEFLTFVGDRLGRQIRGLADVLAHLDGQPHADRFSADLQIERLFIPFATRILVHSMELEQRFQSLDVDVPVHRIRLMSPKLTQAQRLAGRARLKLTDDMFVFGAFGFIGQYKRIDKVLSAWRHWSNRPDNARLLIVGAKQYDITIPRLDGLNYFDFVESESEFLQYVASCDCGVQLRHPTLGETSSMVSTLLANSIPVIVSDTTATEEYAGIAGVERIKPDETEIERLTAAMQRAAGRPRSLRRFKTDYDPAICTHNVLSLIGLPSLGAVPPT